jgi:hypothetical protein
MCSIAEKIGRSAGALSQVGAAGPDRPAHEFSIKSTATRRGQISNPADDTPTRADTLQARLRIGRLRLSPKRQRESSSYDEPDDAHRHGNRRAPDQDFGSKDESQQVRDGDQGKYQDGNQRCGLHAYLLRRVRGLTPAQLTGRLAAEHV